jgi:uncharacterized protein YjbI with pentapeptide repeats
MDFNQLSSLSGVLQGVAVIAAGAIAVAAWWSRIIRKSAARDIGLVFRETIQGLSSTEIEVRMASAVLMRRFFDPASELGVGKAPFTKEAISSISAVLRVSDTSEFQKVLADGLRFAPPGSLREADFQRANLTNANLGGQLIDVSRADFFQANLSGATLRNINAREAIFYEATLVGTRFSGADLSGANFTRALVESVDFSHARLAGANFAGAILRNVKMPQESGAQLEGAIIQTVGELRADRSLKVFVSRPGLLDRRQEAQFEAICGALRGNGCILEQLLPERYDQTYVLSNLASRMKTCEGLVVFGFVSLHVKDGVFRPGTEQSRALQNAAYATAWSHVEAGMALMQGIPVLLLSERGVSEGVFDMRVNDPLIFRSRMEDALDTRQQVLPLWLSAVLAVSIAVEDRH